MENKNTHILLVLTSTLLFLTFSMMHEFDWLIPVNPATVAAPLSSIPVTDIVEEPGSEDEIEHEHVYEILPYDNKSFFGTSIALKHLFTPSVPLPPPDMV
jgi:hypothetical protein